MQEANLFDLFIHDAQAESDPPDEFTKLAVCAAMSDVFAFCYLGSYSNTHRDSSTDFDMRVLSHLLTHDLAHRFQIGGLVLLTANNFKNAFLWFCATSTAEDVKRVLQRCASPDFVRESGLTGIALGLLHDTALAVFAHQIGVYKTGGKFKEALELMEAVPMATAELYSRPTIRQENAQDEGEETEEYEEQEEDEDEADLQEEGNAETGQRSTG